MGPDCRDGFNAGISPETQTKANELTCQAAIYAKQGCISSVIALATEIEKLGLTVLADKVRRRFVNAAKNAKIEIKEKDGKLFVNTPFRRNADFITAWRKIPGRQYDYDTHTNIVPVAAKTQVWALLKTYFPKIYGNGPKGLFRVPE